MLEQKRGRGTLESIIIIVCYISLSILLISISKPVTWSYLSLPVATLTANWHYKENTSLGFLQDFKLCQLKEVKVCHAMILTYYAISNNGGDAFGIGTIYAPIWKCGIVCIAKEIASTWTYCANITYCCMDTHRDC